MNVCVRCRKRFTPQNYSEANGWVCAPCMVDALKAELAELKRLAKAVIDSENPAELWNTVEALKEKVELSQTRSDVQEVSIYALCGKSP